MERRGVVKKEDEATEYRVNSITLAEKTNGQIRICLDPTDLNLAIINISKH